jgi:hypothetical protein
MGLAGDHTADMSLEGGRMAGKSEVTVVNALKKGAPFGFLGYARKRHHT